MEEPEETYALGNLPKAVLRFDLRKLDDYRGKIFENPTRVVGRR